MLDRLHSSHLCDVAMLRLARGSFFWPKMSKEIKMKYQQCEACLENKPSKPEKKVSVIPEDLVQLAPNEMISTDFFEYNDKDFMIIVDRVSGFIFSRMTKNKTQQEAIKVLHEYIHLFGIPHTVKSDGGPAYQSLFSEFLRGMHVEHRYSSSYHPSSNGQCERGVRSVKEVLKKEGRTVTKEHLAEVCFKINCNQEEGTGSRAERFFRRRPRSLLPNSIKRELNHRDLIKIRHDRQMKLAMAKGREAKDKFEINDLVRVQCQINKTWKKKGKIVDVRVSEDGSQQSFIIRMENGREAIRHKSHLRHAGAVDGPAKKVRFEEEVIAKQKQEEHAQSEPIEKATRPKTRAETAREQLREESASQTDIATADQHVQITGSRGEGRHRRNRRI